ncbi:MAG: hypothetical protein AAF436_05040 [Myxococcota bacterium]
MHVERGGGRVLVAGDMTDRSEVASDRGHVREGRVSEVVGAQMPGFMLGGEDLARGLEENSAVLEAREDEAFVGADLIERAAGSRRQRHGAGVARLVDVLGDPKGVVSALVVLRDLEPPHRPDAKAGIPDDCEERLDRMARHRGPFRQKGNDRLGLLARERHADFVPFSAVVGGPGRPFRRVPNDGSLIDFASAFGPAEEVPKGRELLGDGGSFDVAETHAAVVLDRAHGEPLGRLEEGQEVVRAVPTKRLPALRRDLRLDLRKPFREQDIERSQISLSTLQSATGNSLGVDSRRLDLSSCKISDARGSVLPSTTVREADRVDTGAAISTERPSF